MQGTTQTTNLEKKTHGFEKNIWFIRFHHPHPEADQKELRVPSLVILFRRLLPLRFSVTPKTIHNDPIFPTWWAVEVHVETPAEQFRILNCESFCQSFIMLSYTETWNVISSQKLKIWECPTGEQVTAHCLLSNRKEKLFKFSISWTDVFATSKQMATHQWINFWSFWGQLILTPSDHHWMLKIFLHPNGFEKKHAKILNYINSLLDYWSLKCFGISGTIFQPPECTFSVDLEGCHFGEVHGPAIREVQRFNWTPWLHGKRYNTDTKSSENQPKNMRKKDLWIIPVGSIAWILTGDICRQLHGAGKYRWITCHFLQG